MRALLVGSIGMLGSDFLVEAQRRGWQVVAPSLGELDITEPESVARIAAGEYGSFDWCVNCAAYTAVDKAESEERLANAINAIGAGYLARSCLMAGSRILHVSTDFVFDGTASEPYAEDAPPRPLGAYGRSKLDGEIAVQEAHPNAAICRTAWLYGPNGPSFPRTMIRVWGEGKPLRVVADQIGCPTYTADLARVMADLMELNPFPGIYHAVGPEIMSWHAFAIRTLRTWKEVAGAEQEVEVTAIKTDEWPTPTRRPAYSVLSTAKIEALGIPAMRPVEVALREFCERMRKG